MPEMREKRRMICAMGAKRAVAAAAMLLCAGTALADADTSTTDATPVIEAHDGFMTDLELLAEARGWTLEEAVAHRALSDAFGKIQQRVATARPELYAGAALSDLPEGTPTLYIKGTTDDFVWNLVDSTEIPIDVVDGMPYSWLELEERSIRLNRLLAERGFLDIVTTFDERTAVVEGYVTRVPGFLATADELLEMLPAEFRANTVLTITHDDVATDDTAFGGMWVRDDGFNECTSGWSVTNGSTTGVTTAGHCTGINEIDHPGHGVHSLTHVAEHRGVWGDIEWTTSTQVEPDDFYASAAQIRDVAAVEPRANITVGEAICVYGRSSNRRDCSDTVFRTSISCTNSGVFNDRLVAMNAKRTTIGGDSGGGWSFNFTAYGSHKGGCSVSGAVRNAFSVADLYDEALGVTVLTQPPPPPCGGSGSSCSSNGDCCSGVCACVFACGLPGGGVFACQ